MKKLLLIAIGFAFAGSGMAQNTRVKTNAANASTGVTSTMNIVKRTSTQDGVICGIDTVTYLQAKIGSSYSGYRLGKFPTLKGAPSFEWGQFYPLNGSNAELRSMRIFANPLNKNATAVAATAKVYIANADSTPGRLVDSVNFTMPYVAVKYVNDVTRIINFPKAVKLDSNFVITIENIADSAIVYGAPNPVAKTYRVEYFTVLSYKDSAFERGPLTGLTFDMAIEPVLAYSIKADFHTTAGAAKDQVNFINASNIFLTNRVYNARLTYDTISMAASPLRPVYSFGDGTPRAACMLSLDTMHTYGTDGVYTAVMKDSLMTWYQIDYNKTPVICTDTAVHTIDLSTGILGLSQLKAASFNLYPNPTSGELTISSKEGVVTSVVVMDLVGKTVMATIPVNNKINMSQLTEGMYFVRISTANGTVVKKVNLTR